MISASHAGALYQKLLNQIMRQGARSKPRNLETRELLNVQCVLHDALENIIVNQARDLNYRFMVAEWLWILFGRKDVSTIARYNKNIAQFSDDGVEFYGAYGPRIRSQWNHVVTALTDDADSRQA